MCRKHLFVCFVITTHVAYILSQCKQLIISALYFVFTKFCIFEKLFGTKHNLRWCMGKKDQGKRGPRNKGPTGFRKKGKGGYFSNL